jgi:LPS sulfotransferase NodH
MTTHDDTASEVSTSQQHDSATGEYLLFIECLARDLLKQAADSYQWLLDTQDYMDEARYATDVICDLQSMADTPVLFLALQGPPALAALTFRKHIQAVYWMNDLHAAAMKEGQSHEKPDSSVAVPKQPLKRGDHYVRRRFAMPGFDAIVYGYVVTSADGVARVTEYSDHYGTERTLLEAHTYSRLIERREFDAEVPNDVLTELAPRRDD